MTRILFALFIFYLLNSSVFGQSIQQKIKVAAEQLANDSQAKNGIVGFYVADVNTGQEIFSLNGSQGLATASSLKVLTAASAWEYFGGDYRYKTYYTTSEDNKNFHINIYASGDPTFGSWRYAATKDQVENFSNLVKKKNTLNKPVVMHFYYPGFEFQPVPEGWLWQDMGNYYGAGAWPFNFHENQFDLHLRSSDKIGDTVRVIKTYPVNLVPYLRNNITAAKKGSGDNAYIFSSPFQQIIYANGTIGAGENNFVISGSIPQPADAMADMISLKTGVPVDFNESYLPGNTKIPGGVDSILSPTLDSINFWFLRRSINLYGEALLKSIAIKAGKLGSTQNGAEVISFFWKNRGIDPDELRMMDGSGLSPANRVSARALTQVLLYAKKQNWYPSFYNALPFYNNIKMKSGNIGGVMSYTGYVNNYAFSIIVNNYGGSSAAVRAKLFRVLDVLK